MTKVLFSFLFLSSLVLTSCDHSKKMVDHEWVVYHAVMEHGDITAALNSLNRIVVIEKYNADALDTLAILYLAAGSNEAAVKIATRALSVRESDQLTYTLAKANKNIGNYQFALDNYSKLLTKTPNSLEYLYEVAYANINLKKLNEALPHIKSIIDHPESGSEVMQEFISEGSQLVPFKAVAFNMLGFIQSTGGQQEAAVNSYQAALQIYPKYYLASNNLKVTREKMNTK